MSDSKGHSFGWIPSVPDMRDRHFVAKLAIDAPVPDHVDLRNEFMPPVYDQGALGSCTGQAIGAAVAYDRAKQGVPGLNPSRLFVYYNERVLEGTVKSDAGAQIRDGIKVIAKQGVPDEKLWPYKISSFARKPTIAAYRAALANRGAVYERVGQTLHEMQMCLASGSPFTVGFTVYESFETPDVATTGIAPMPHLDERVLGGHAVLVVGYDNAIAKWKVRNSWGPQWGAAGYFTMPFDYLLNPSLSDDFWVIRTLV